MLGLKLPLNSKSLKGSAIFALTGASGSWMMDERTLVVENYSYYINKCLAHMDNNLGD